MDIIEFLRCRAPELQAYADHLRLTLPSRRSGETRPGRSSCSRSSGSDYSADSVGDGAEDGSKRYATPITATLNSPQYRKPSSPNIPLSRVLEEERRQATKRSEKQPGRSVQHRGAAGGGKPTKRAARSSSKKIILDPGKQLLYLKRRKRLWYRMRPTARRRHIRRRAALRVGKYAVVMKLRARRLAKIVAKAAGSNVGGSVKAREKRPRSNDVEDVESGMPTVAYASSFWLPSHLYMRSGFSFIKKQRCVQAIADRESEDTEGRRQCRRGESGVALRREVDPTLRRCVTLMVPAWSLRRQHRAMQRWVAQGSWARTRPRRPRVAGGNALDAVESVVDGFLCDGSDHFIWEIVRRPGSTTHTLVDLRQLAGLLGMWPQGPASGDGSSGNASHDGHRSMELITAGLVEVRPDCVLRGFMWSVEAFVEATPDAESASRCRGPRVVPVLLLQTSRGDDAQHSWLLIAPADVSVSHRFLRRCNRSARPSSSATDGSDFGFELISLWNPAVGPVAPRAALFEWWLAASPSSAFFRPSDPVRASHEADDPLQSVARRHVSAACARVRAAVARVVESKTKKDEGEAGAQLSDGDDEVPVVFLVPQPHAEPMGAAVTPSKPTPRAPTAFQHRVRVFWIVVLLMRKRPCVTQRVGVPTPAAGPMPPCSPHRLTSPVVWQSIGRRLETHFTFSRRLFLCLRRSTMSSSGASWRLSSRCIGSEERKQLMHLCGCPAFPDDFVLPAGATVRSGPPLPMPHAPTTLRTLTVLDRYLSPARAHQFVLLKFAVRGYRLHQRDGCLLFHLIRRTQAGGGGPADSNAVLTLRRLGVVTSHFFSAKFGCRLGLAYVWQPEGLIVPSAARPHSVLFTASPETASALEPQPLAVRVLQKRARRERAASTARSAVSPPSGPAGSEQEITEVQNRWLISVLSDPQLCADTELVTLH